MELTFGAVTGVARQDSRMRFVPFHLRDGGPLPSIPSAYKSHFSFGDKEREKDGLAELKAIFGRCTKRRARRRRNGSVLAPCAAPHMTSMIHDIVPLKIGPNDSRRAALHRCIE